MSCLGISEAKPIRFKFSFELLVPYIASIWPAAPRILPNNPMRMETQP
jgi:hypothetical protein